MQVSRVEQKLRRNEAKTIKGKVTTVKREASDQDNGEGK